MHPFKAKKCYSITLDINRPHINAIFPHIKLIWGVKYGVFTPNWDVTWGSDLMSPYHGNMEYSPNING